MTAPVYATREQVQRALDVKETARAAAQIDRALDSASRSVEGLTHRRFYPQIATRYFDWPNRQYAPPWRLWLSAANELISITTLTTGGTTIAASDFFLRRSDQLDEPPYTLLELDLDSNAAFGGSATQQRDITILGLYGHSNNETTAGTLAAAVSSTTATTVTVDGPASAALGVGSVLRVDSERMIVAGRTQVTTGQALLVPVGAGKAEETLQVTTPSAYTPDEVLLLDSERMLITDVSSVLTVKRAWDGSTLAAHTAPTIYAARTLTVQRGSLGTTAATHSNAAPAYRWDPPGPVNALTIAEAMNTLLQEQAGYGRTIKTAGGRSVASEADALGTLRDQVYASHGRKGRVGAV
jgi:hypothetical protein